MISTATTSSAPSARSAKASNGRRVGFAAVLVAALALLLTACNPANDLTNLINGSRSQVGARALSANATITVKAQTWAQHMADINQLVHSNLADGNNLQWRALAENIGNFPASWSMADINNAFLNSPGHRANMLNGNYNYVGIGMVTVNNRIWVVEEFMQL